MDVQQLIKLRPSESVVTVIHQDLRRWMPRMALLVMWFLAPFFFFFPLMNQGWIGWVVFVAMVVPALFFLLRALYCWHRTVLIVTTARLVYVRQHRLLERQVIDIPFARLEDITFLAESFVSRFFHMGYLHLHVQDREEEVVIAHVPYPERIARLLSDLTRVYGSSTPASRTDKVVSQ